jgi:hypothetical protein
MQFISGINFTQQLDLQQRLVALRVRLAGGEMVSAGGGGDASCGVDGG